MYFRMVKVNIMVKAFGVILWKNSPELNRLIILYVSILGEIKARSAHKIG